MSSNANSSVEVETLGWDITFGFTNTKFGRVILKATSDDKSNVPESIEHVGIKIFGSVYEYGDWGVIKTEISDEVTKLKSKYPAGKLKSVHNFGSTSKTQEEFEAWIDEQSKGEFRGSKYDVVNNSCLVWGKRACEFLGVDYPANWDKIQSYAQKNKRLATAMGASVMSTRKSSHD